ncbi:glycosyltransferase involved in cell wall biosynthesis [Methanococcus maripaludis]|uniref:Glycosyltransferase involved in cell wall biosynthesis n=2 Tax=Methanococcus maripaludis TaxID=39152 RepID=A0A7J9NVV6_METMI|nr:glycosyltransferase involved in cell wall biosynthesis [Methanococcus maripaludis]
MYTESFKVTHKNNIDVIHSHWSIPSGFISSLLLSNTPQVITLHGSDIKIYSKKFPYKLLVKYSISRADKIITVSNDLKDIAISCGCDPKKIVVIPNGVDIDKFKPVNKEYVKKLKNISSNFLICYVGSLIKIKRVDRLIKISNELSKDYNIDLLIIGDGPERNNLENLVSTLGMKNVKFQGAVPNEEIPEYISMSDVLALTSESEGLPTVLVESMSCGVPVITLDVGGVKDIVKNGINGFVVNDKEEFKEKLIKYIENEDLKCSHGAAGRKLIEEEQSIDKTSLRLSKLYGELINTYKKEDGLSA